MSKYVPDILSQKWAIISSSRSTRPDEFEKTASKAKGPPKCPFCEGNESMSSDELYRVGKGEKNERGWDVRVVSNKFPITDYHEVIVHSPDDKKGLHELPLKHVQKVLLAYKERFNFHKPNGQVIIFCNEGAHSGASIGHSHSQLVVIPSQINLDTLKKEKISNVVTDNTFFTVYCPEYSEWPYEVWLAPKEDGRFFGEITEEETFDLAEILQKVLKRLQILHENSQFAHKQFSYNFYIHPKENWYLRIIPRFVTRAGFELGTGLSVNMVDPVEASMELRGVEPPMMKVMSKLEKWE